MENHADQSPVLLYDGVCGFCNWAVQFVMDRDRRGTLRFAPLQGKYGEEMKLRHPVLQSVDSIVYVDRSAESGQEHVFIRSSGGLRVISYLGGPWRVFLLAYVIPAPIRDFFYDLFARYRYRLFGKFDTCRIPPPESRSRFLE